MRTFQGWFANEYSDGKIGTAFEGKFYNGYTTFGIDGLVRGIEGKDLVHDVVLNALFGYEDKLKEGKRVNVYVEWDIKDDYSEYISARLLKVEVVDKPKE